MARVVAFVILFLTVVAFVGRVDSELPPLGIGFYNGDEDTATIPDPGSWDEPAPGGTTSSGPRGSPTGV
jgi:hypothetical protein